MKISSIGHRTRLALFVLFFAPFTVSASELGRFDVAAPGAMISTCSGLNAGGSAYAIGDKGWWVAGKFNCNATQTAVPLAQH